MPFLPSRRAPAGPGRAVRPAATAALAGSVLLVSVVSAGCSAATATSTPPLGAVVDAASTTFLDDHHWEFAVPSGRLTISTTDGTDVVPGVDTASGEELRAAPGSVLVGVGWRLEQGYYPDRIDQQVADPSVVLGAPREVGLRIVAGDTDVDVAGLGSVAAGGTHPGDAVWLVLPADAAPALHLEVAYDGLTQTGGLVSGAARILDRGAAAALYRALPRVRTAPCSPGAEECQVAYAVGYPYLDGAGWAEDGRTFAVATVRTGDDPPDPDLAGAATLAGSRSVATLTNGASVLRGFAVPGGRSGPSALELRMPARVQGRVREVTAVVRRDPPDRGSLS